MFASYFTPAVVGGGDAKLWNIILAEKNQGYELPSAIT